MKVHLYDYERLCISFSCPGATDVSSIPSWIELKPPKHKNIAQIDQKPFYNGTHAVPSELLAVIQTKQCFGLQKVTARDRYDNNSFWGMVLTFVLVNEKPHHQKLAEPGIDILSKVLQLCWRKARIFEDRETNSLCLSFSEKSGIAKERALTMPDEFGISRLIIQ